MGRMTPLAKTRMRSMRAWTAMPWAVTAWGVQGVLGFVVRCGTVGGLGMMVIVLFDRLRFPGQFLRLFLLLLTILDCNKLIIFSHSRDLSENSTNTCTANTYTHRDTHTHMYSHNTHAHCHSHAHSQTRAFKLTQHSPVIPVHFWTRATF